MVGIFDFEAFDEKEKKLIFSTWPDHNWLREIWLALILKFLLVYLITSQFKINMSYVDINKSFEHRVKEKKS